MINSIISAEMANQSASPSGYVLPPDIVLVMVQDGTGRLLNLGGSFYALTATAAAMLHEVLRAAPGTVVAQLAAHYLVPEDRIRADLLAMLTDLERKGLIRRRGKVHILDSCLGFLTFVVLPPALFCIHASPFSTHWKAKFLLGLSYLSFRIFGFARTLTAWRRCHRADRAARLLSDKEAVMREADAAVRITAAEHFLKTDCKERALACFSILVKQRVPARLVLGISLYPFAGHCWVECDGKVLTDYGDHCSRFTPVLTLA
jgi:Transglutaminase-like superfamily/Coenzyme PQQ synthesis protein D (PqqD)